MAARRGWHLVGDYGVAVVGVLHDLVHQLRDVEDGGGRGGSRNRNRSLSPRRGWVAPSHKRRRIRRRKRRYKGRCKGSGRVGDVDLLQVPILEIEPGGRVIEELKVRRLGWRRHRGGTHRGVISQVRQRVQVGGVAGAKQKLQIAERCHRVTGQVVGQRRGRHQAAHSAAYQRRAGRRTGGFGPFQWMELVHDAD